MNTNHVRRQNSFYFARYFSTLAMTSSVSNARVARVKKYNGSTFSILNKTLFRRRNKFRNPDCKITTTLDLVVCVFGQATYLYACV